MQQEPVDPARLLERTKYYAKKAGASDSSIQNMLDMLQSPLGQAVLQMASGPDLTSLLVNDLYKVHMQSMYAQYMTGVTADFALNIRKCPRLKPAADRHSSTTASSTGSSFNPAAYLLADIKEQHPAIFSELTARITQQLQSIDPLGQAVVEALQEFNGYTPPQVLLERSRAHDVASVEWVDIEGAPVAVGSGPIEAASNTETSVMQAVQAAIIAAAAATHSVAGSSGSSGVQQSGVCFDRTERLGSSLGKMVWTVEQLNDIPHEFGIMLMAGRRSTDLLHLVLQNLYFMKHVSGYKGTSSLLAAAVLRQLLQQQGVAVAERRALVGHIMGTHAHEMTSMVQQVMAGYDAEAGRRCGLQSPVCISQLLAHMLFLTANGGSSSSSSSTYQTESPSTDTTGTANGPTNSSSSRRFVGGTALADTFTTPYFVHLAEVTQVPEEFVSDIRDKWGLEIEQGSKVFDLFSVWRLDSGSYRDLAQLIHDTWARRNKARAAAGLAQLPPLQLLHSNISTLEDIRELVSLPPHIRPVMLGFGGLADGFMPFDHTAATSAPASAAPPSSTTLDPAASAVPPPTAEAPPPPPAAAAAGQQSVTLPVCSLVMKAVQARLPAHITDSDSTNSAAADAPAGPTPSVPPPSTAAAAAAVMPSVHQACAVKLGDGDLSKAQTDPRLPAKARQGVLQDMQAMVKAGGQLEEETHGAALSQVLREAYVAVVREGVLMAK